MIKEYQRHLDNISQEDIALIFGDIIDSYYPLGLDKDVKISVTESENGESVSLDLHYFKSNVLTNRTLTIVGKELYFNELIYLFRERKINSILDYNI